MSLMFVPIENKEINKQLYLRRVAHNSNSTEELVALDPKSTIIRVKIVFEDYKSGRQFFIK